MGWWGASTSPVGVVARRRNRTDQRLAAAKYGHFLGWHPGGLCMSARKKPSELTGAAVRPPSLRLP
jgi:hypothetical protein